MPVNITDEELDIFNQNGFTDDDVKATVENYRSQGLDDVAIRTKIDDRLSSWANTQPAQTEQSEQPTFIQGGISKNVQYQEEHPIKEAVRGAGREIARALLPEKAENWFIGSKKDEDFLKEYGNKEVKNYDQLTYEYNNGQISKQEYIDGINLRNELDNAIAEDEYRQERNKNIGKGAVEIGSGFIPVGAGAKVATKGAQLLRPALGKAVSKAVAQGTVGGALGGAAMGLGEGLIDRDINPVTQSLLYGGFGGLTGGALGGVGGGIANKIRANAIAKRKATPLYDRMSETALNEATAPASDYGVANINAEQNREIGAQINDRVQKELDTLKAYKDLHAELNKKYGNINKLKKQANADKPMNAQYGTRSEALDDYEKLIEAENELLKTKYINYSFKSTSSGQKIVKDNALQNSVRAQKRAEKINPVEQPKEPINAEVQTPKEAVKGSGEKVDRGLSKSILEAEGTPKEVRELIQNDLPQYRVLHNNELTERAVAEVEKDFDNELSRLSTAKDYDALDYEKSRQIAKRLFQSGRYKEAVNLMDNVSANATEKGQAIQALSLWSNMTPEGAVYKAEKLINAYNKKYPKRKPKSLSDENIKTIQQLQENVLNSADDVTKTQNMARTAKYISELVPANLGKKLKTYRNISLLLNPKTLGRNIIGNALFNTVDTVSKALAVPFDRAIGLVTKENTRALPQINELLKGGLYGLKTGVKEAIEGIDTRGLGQRFDLNTGRTLESPVGKFFETALDVGLRAPDRMQYEATFAESVANIMKAKGLKEPTQEILEQAEREALESVFQNESNLGNLTLNLRKGLNTIGTKDFGLGDLLIPYAQTPANLAQQGINYSPLGALKAIGNLAQSNQRQASLDLARATLGSGLMGGGYALGENQLATPSQFDDNYNKNRDIKNNLQTIGIRPDQIGDIWYSPFQPASIPLSVGIASAYGENPYQAATNTLVELPFLQSLSRAISDIKDKGVAEAGINFAGSVPSQFVPTAGSQIGQAFDPYLRETSNSNKIIQGLNQAAVKIPGVSRLYPEKIDVTGKPIERYSTEGAQRLFDIFINPTFINKKTSDPIISELKNLYDNTKETKQFLLTAEKSLKRVTDENGKPLKLDGKQLSDYQKALGQKTYEEFDYLMGSEEYQNADDDKKVDMLNDRRNTIKQLVEFEMFGVPISNSYKNKVNRLYINME